ncbi:MAG: SH3 domain-containing protein [Lachnospiraceae bacterium]|nr:SH3 domain-containing protein [Lachnospiraceae bacterium]
MTGLAVAACGKSDKSSETEADEESAELQTIEFDTGTEEPVETAQIPEPVEEIPVIEETPLPEEPLPEDVPAEPAETEAAPSADYTVEDISEVTLYTTETVNMRTGPSSQDFDVAEKLSAGTQVTANGKVNGYKGDGKSWYRIKKSDGSTGYFIIADYLSDKKPEKKEETAENQDEAAKKAADEAAKKAADEAAKKAADEAAKKAAEEGAKAPAAGGYAQYGERAQCAKDWDDTRAAGYGKKWSELDAGLQTDLYNHWVAKGPTW